MMVVLALDIRGIYYYKMHEEISANRYLKFFKTLMNRWHGDRRYAV